MVYTVTFNPSLDYVVRLDFFSEGKVNRTAGEKILPGGKGINVSIMLNHLGIANTALGFVAGFTGREIERLVSKAGCNTGFIPLREGCSRINIKMKAQAESEINGRGPDISKRELSQLFHMLDEAKDGDWLVLAGSIPDSLPDSVYMDILEQLKGKKIKAVVDATGELLVRVLPYHPFLIKPNHHEMEEIFGTEMKTEEQLVFYGKKLMEMGAGNVLISRAGAGAIFLGSDGNVISAAAASGKVVNSVGAGDSMVAGFVAGYMETEDYGYALKMGLAAGSASAFSENLATKEEVKSILKQL